MMEAAKKYQMVNCIKAVSLYYGVPVEAIRSHSRLLPYVEARHHFCWLARMKRGLSFPRIGMFINRDHSTVQNSVKMFSKHADSVADKIAGVDAILEEML